MGYNVGGPDLDLFVIYIYTFKAIEYVPLDNSNNLLSYNSRYLRKIKEKVSGFEL